MTTTVLTRGSNWGVFANHGVYANWGECGEGADVDATYEMLGDRVVDRFHELADERGINAHWSPGTSEVIGDVGQDIDDGLLDQLRKQAAAQISEQWTNGEIDPVST